MGERNERFAFLRGRWREQFIDGTMREKLPQIKAVITSPEWVMNLREKEKMSFCEWVKDLFNRPRRSELEELREQFNDLHSNRVNRTEYRMINDSLKELYLLLDRDAFRVQAGYLDNKYMLKDQMREVAKGKGMVFLGALDDGTELWAKPLHKGK